MPFKNSKIYRSKSANEEAIPASSFRNFKSRVLQTVIDKLGSIFLG